MSLGQLGGTLFTTPAASTERSDEARRTSAPSTSAGASTAANEAYVESASEDKDANRQRCVNPSPSTQARREDEADVVDLTDDPPQTTKSKRPAVAPTASQATRTPATPSATPAGQSNAPGGRANKEADKESENISLMKGGIQGTPLQIPAIVYHKYLAKITQTRDVCVNREGKAIMRVHTLLGGILQGMREAPNLASLVELHGVRGKDALSGAKRLLTSEHEQGVEAAEEMKETAKRGLYKETILKDQRIRVENVNNAIRYCNELIEEVKSLRQSIRQMRMENGVVVH